MTMMRTEINAAIDGASPGPGDMQRLHDIGAKCGQLFGWVTGPDQLFLADWLPNIAASWPTGPMRIVEVGTFGGSTARGLIVLSRGGMVTCIDNFADMNTATLNFHKDGKAFWTHTLKGPPDLSGYATLKVGDSREIGGTWNLPIDLAFIDGAHDHATALSDLVHFAAHVVPGGYCLVDDFDMPDVARACADYFGPQSNAGGWRLIAMPPAGGKIFVMQRAS